MNNEDLSPDSILAASQRLNWYIETTIGNLGSQEIQDNDSETEIRANTVALARQAFMQRDPVALEACHCVLYRLLSARMGLCKADGDRTIVRFAVEQILLDEFLNSEAKRIDITEMPIDRAGIVEWWDGVLAPYIECPHPLFRFLEQEATFVQYREFLSHDLGVHVRFDDALSSLIIGTHGRIRSEILANLSDELGMADGEAPHMTMAMEVADVFGVDIGLGSTLWQSLACANSLMAYCAYGSLFPEAAGYLGCLEALTPSRFRMLGSGGERVGIPNECLRYYFEHAELDDDHASGWLQNVIVPLVEGDQRNAQRIRNGVGHRLRVSAEYWDAVCERIRDD